MTPWRRRDNGRKTPDFTGRPMPLPGNHARFVLMHTSHPGNVGAAARAMKVMGFSDLVLVSPRQAGVTCHEDTVAMASGAADILARARVVDTLAEALEGCTYACATAMTPRDFGPPTFEPRAHCPRWRGRCTAWPSCSGPSARGSRTTTFTVATPA